MPRSLEAGVMTVDCGRAIEELRMRVSIICEGSFNLILRSLPARLDHAGILPLEPKIPAARSAKIFQFTG